MTVVLVVAQTSAGAPLIVTRATGPLRVHPKNPRYFMDESGKAIYLTGSHTWSTLQDQGPNDPPPTFDYDHYLAFLEKYNHNFIRLWAWEQARWAPWADGRGRDPRNWLIEPNPYARTGPGLARDGKPKFNLTKFDPAYFDRLHERVRKAGKHGIYVSVMLFQGWSSAKSWYGGKPWLGHPYYPDNNTEGFNGNLKGSGGPDLGDPRVRERQKAYLRKVVDSVNDLDNVLYEVTNEGGTKDWDWWVVRTVQEYEKTKPKQHPVGLTGHGSESNEEMLASPATWISPGSKNWPDLKDTPRPAPGTKVCLLDTDHVFGIGGDHKWVWKSFLRGYNVLYMDPYDDPLVAGQNVGVKDIDGARRAMGYTRRFAERMDLASMTPQPALTSTGYCLAHIGAEYLVYQPKAGEAFTVSLPGGMYRYRWFNAQQGETATGGLLSAETGTNHFQPPPDCDAVLYLKAADKRLR